MATDFKSLPVIGTNENPKFYTLLTLITIHSNSMMKFLQTSLLYCSSVMIPTWRKMPAWLKLSSNWIKLVGTPVSSTWYKIEFSFISFIEFLISGFEKRSDFEQIGHGISENLINKVREITREFFKLPYEEKLKIKMTPSAGYRFVYIINSFPNSNSFLKIDVTF